jgi:hypothetical protein
MRKTRANSVYTPEVVEAITQARKRGITWKAIGDAIGRSDASVIIGYNKAIKKQKQKTKPIVEAPSGTTWESVRTANLRVGVPPIPKDKFELIQTLLPLASPLKIAEIVGVSSRTVQRIKKGIHPYQTGG